MAANPGPGFLCHVCAKASGADPFKKPAAPRKRKDPAEKRKVTSFEETERVKSLAKMCIEVCWFDCLPDWTPAVLGLIISIIYRRVILLGDWKVYR